MDEREYPIMEHLKQLRTYLWRAIIGVVVCAIVCLLFSNELLWILRKPMEQALQGHGKFVVLAPLEYFMTQMKIGMVAGIFLASPWVLWQLWRFVSPGLHKKEKQYATIFVGVGAFFFILGAVFAYFLMFPMMFQILIGTLPEGIEGNFSIGMLYGFAMNLLLAFGVAFETPVIVCLLAITGIVDLETFTKARRYVIVIAFIVGAVMTTPDPITQIMLAIPLIFLYELGMLAAKMILRSRSRDLASA